MANNIIQSYPLPSIQRLPIYLRLLKEARDRGETIVSCTKISEEVNQLSVQIRKDLSITGIVGRPKVGYQINDLIAAIETFLGWNRKTNAFLIGAGSLGSAILKYEGFVEHGLNIVAAFDVNPELFGKTIHQCSIYPIDKLTELAKDQTIEIGILTVPANVAQKAADLLLKIGVQAIWNYTPARLDLPAPVICEDVKLSASFAVLSSRLMNRGV